MVPVGHSSPTWAAPLPAPLIQGWLQPLHFHATDVPAAWSLAGTALPPVPGAEGTEP